MNLAIDIGNTKTKVAVFDRNELIFETAHKGFDTQLVFDAINNFSIDACIVSSVAVVPELDEAPFPVLYFNHKTPLPIQNNYATPETLGLDRLAGVVAAYFLFKGKNSLVIDAGTCNTFDFIDADGVYEGGSIHPGIEMRARAMNTFTHRLPFVNVRFESIDENSWLGKSTETCLQSGAIWGTVCEIESMADRYQNWLLNSEKKRKNTDLTIIMTGGAAPLLERCTKKQIFARPFLILEGLNQILIWNEHTLPT